MIVCATRGRTVTDEDVFLHSFVRVVVQNRKKSRKLYRVWSDAETRALRAGVAEHGVGSWAAIKRDGKYASTLSMRSNVDLKDKWRSITSIGSPRKPPSPSLGRGPPSPQYLAEMATLRRGSMSPRRASMSPQPTTRVNEHSRLSPMAKNVLNELRASGQVPAHAQHLSPQPLRASSPYEAEYDDDDGFEDEDDGYDSPEPTTREGDDKSNCSMM